LPWSSSVKPVCFRKKQPGKLGKASSLKEMEIRYAQHRKREGGVDSALGLGSPDPVTSGGVSPAWVHLIRSSVVLDVSTVS
jgi:hypothetical protein